MKKILPFIFFLFLNISSYAQFTIAQVTGKWELYKAEENNAGTLTKLEIPELTQLLFNENNDLDMIKGKETLLGTFAIEKNFLFLNDVRFRIEKLEENELVIRSRQGLVERIQYYKKIAKL